MGALKLPEVAKRISSLLRAKRDKNLHYDISDAIFQVT